MAEPHGARFRVLRLRGPPRGVHAPMGWLPRQSVRIPTGVSRGGAFSSVDVHAASRLLDSACPRGYTGSERVAGGAPVGFPGPPAPGAGPQTGGDPPPPPGPPFPP